MEIVAKSQKSPRAKDCSRRQSGCHSSCEGYKEFYIANEQRKKDERERKDSQRTLSDYTFNSVVRIKKLNKRRK